MQTFPVTLNLRIDWSELDLFGHVNNVSFFKYIQAARLNYWEHIGLYQYFQETKTGPMVVNSSCNFKKPLFYPGNILIESRCEFIKTTSFGLQHRILNDANEIAAEAHDVMVIFNFLKNEKAPFPIQFREAAEKLEGRKFPLEQ